MPTGVRRAGRISGACAAPGATGTAPATGLGLRVGGIGASRRRAASASYYSAVLWRMNLLPDPANHAPTVDARQDRESFFGHSSLVEPLIAVAVGRFAVTIPRRRQLPAGMMNRRVNRMDGAG